MGCDFFYSAKLADKALQEKVIHLVSDYHGENAVLIHPSANVEYFTEYDFSDSLQYPKDLTTRMERSMYRLKHGTKHMRYPFNYYGVIPLYDWEFEEHGQFIFDRSAAGRLVRILKLPIELGLTPRDDFYKDHKAEVVVSEGGYDRIIGGSLHFALLLRIINLRWFAELNVHDDYNVYDSVGKVLGESSLAETFKDESKNYQQCWDLFKSEYDRRCELDPFFCLR
jgi:hypothetical protein